VVSPATGALLASEQVVTTPGRARVTNWASKCRYPHQLIGISTAQLRRLGVSAALCTRLARDGTRYVQYGTRYQGQITFSDVYTKVGWTNAFPHLPAARPGPASAKG